MMVSYDKTLSVSLQQLASLGMGDLANLIIKGLPSPWSLINTKVGSGIQAYTCIGNFIGATNQIALVLGADWTGFLNKISLQGYPALRQQPLSTSIISDPDGSDNLQANIESSLQNMRCLSQWAQNQLHPGAKLLQSLKIQDAPAQVSTETVNFNGPLQSLYMSLREDIWDLMQTAASFVAPANTELMICGQGIGAAFAQLAAYDFRPDKDKISIKFKDIRLYTYSTPLNASTKFKALFEKSISDAWVVNAGISPVVDFFPTEPTVDEQGNPLAQLGTNMPVDATLPQFDAPWWERSGPFYTDVLNTETTSPNPEGAHSTSANGYDAQLSYVLTQLCAAAAKRAQHPQSSANLPSSWSLVKAFPECDPWVSVFQRPSPGLYAVVFRSDISYAEVMNNLANSLAAVIDWLPRMASAHGGAYKIYNDIRTDLRSYLQGLNLSENELVVAGHGLGAMTAMVASLDLNTNTLTNSTKIYAYCYGSPAASGWDLKFNFPDLVDNVFLVKRIQDVIQKVTWNSLLTRYGTEITLSGTTGFDGVSFHSINTYIALLDPSD
ncbi:lipase family protein [Alteromonas sp. S015]|uniref:lipase family protein n=1 Tax=Alteromonas sp. S015 TaxID=3117401 RepID=UPI002FDFC2C4